MRIVLSMLAICAISCMDAAQSAEIERIDITGYGVMADTPRAKVGFGSSGIRRDSSTGDRIEKTTDTIAACIGTRFGIKFRIVGAPNGAPAKLVEATRFPEPGLAVPGAAGLVHEDRYGGYYRIGGDSYVWYQFDARWELVPGIWTFELWAGNRLLASRDFKVVKVPYRKCIFTPSS